MGIVAGMASYGISQAAEGDGAADAESSAQNPITKPLGVSKDDVPPNVMFVMGRDHNLFTAAYSDYTPLTENNSADYFYTIYHPEFIYEGMFASDMCYEYKPLEDSVDTGNDKADHAWVPTSMAKLKKASSHDGTVSADAYYCGDEKWLGNFMNYVTASRLDVIKTALYGGTRLLKLNPDNTYTQYDYTWGDNSISPVLTHTDVLIDAHAWAKVFSPKMYENYPKVPQIAIDEISELTALSSSDGTSPAYFLGVFPKDYKPSGSPRFRVVKVEKANIPGDQGKYALVKECEDGIGNCAVWTWISQESGDNKNFKANEKVGDKFVNTWATKVNDDYLLNVVACNPKLTSKINNNCKEYVSEENQTYHQPEGIVQLYGVGPQARLHFGLLTGGWDSNRTGAMLRDNISNKDNEYDIDKNTGKIIYKTCDGKRCGLAGSLDQFKIIKNNNYYLEDCNREIGVLKAMNGAEKKCGDWGNPIAELLYESVNYFQDKKVDRDGNTSGREDNMKLGCVANTTDTNKPISTRQNPYSESNYCAKAVSFIISDEAPSFDAFGQGSNSSIEKEDQGKITAELQKRFKVSGKYLVGLSTTTTSNEELHYKGMPTIKTINDLSDVVGIAPTQAFSYGSYNVVGVASLALGEDADNLPLSNSARQVKENFNMQTFVLAMKPNMPEVKIPVKNGVVRLIPLAKSPAEVGAIENKDPSNDDASKTKAYQLQSTNQVVGFYIQYSTDTEGLFHVSFEDFEYGSDFDMDWVVGYKYKVIDGTDGNQYVQITMLHEDGDVYTPQHGGYVISGVDYSGTYLDLAKSSSYYLFDEQGNFYSLDNYISDAGFYACKSESSGKNFLDCLVDPSKDLPTSMDFNGGTIVSQYEAIMNKKADVNTGEICSDASDNCRPIYYMPRYMFSRYADYYLNNGKVNNFFKFDINDIDMRLVGDRARVLKQTKNVDGWNSEENHANFDEASDGNAVGITYSSRIFKVSKSESGDVWLKSPLWYAAKAGYTFDQRDGNDNADPVNFSYVTNPAEFRKNIRKLINLLLSSYHSASSFAVQTTNTTNGTAVYATSYNPMNWFGTIYKSPVDGATGSYNFAILNDLKGCWESGCEAYEQNGWWNAAYEFSKMTPENRLIVTYDNNELKRVYVSSNDADDESTTLADLGLDIFGTDGIEHPTGTRLKYIIRWLGGEAKHEGSIEEYEQAVATDDFNVLRERKEGERHFVLGDIVNSDVAVVQAGNQFLLAVGANDGMLHILDEATGKPLVSFIPTEVRTEILRTAEVLYETNHKFFVDSTPKTFSKTIDDTVHTYLYGTLGLNFKGGYLLDLTKIFGTQNSSVEGRFEAIKDDLYGWELKSSKSKLVGQSREAPIYYSVNNKDYFIYSSGYNAVTPGVLVVQGFSDDGKKPELNVKAQIPLGTEANRAISPIEIYARQSSKGLEPISMFVGDTLGRLYQIKLNGAVSGRPDCWGFTNECSGVTINNDEQATDYQPQKAFEAKDNYGNPQMITARPAVAALASGGYAVLFGTGSYWTPFDDTPDSLKQVQTMYCLNRDNGSSTGTNTMDRRMLMPIKHVGDNTCKRNKLNGYAEGECTGNWLASTTSADKPKLKNGWYMDLNAFSGEEAKDLTGERIYRSPLVINKTVYVVSAIPNVSDSCETGGRSYLYTMNVDNGTTVLQQEIKGLANEMVATVHDGQLIVQVPYDGSGDKNTESGVAAIAIPDMRTPNMRRSSWIRLY